jgi:hypothetical protein
VTSSRTSLQLCDQFQSGLRVPWDTKAIETPKMPSYGFFPAVFRPLTLVPIKRVLEYPSRTHGSIATRLPSSSLIVRLLTTVGTSVVIRDLTEPRHPKVMELWLEVRSTFADLREQLRSGRPCGAQASSNPQTVANHVGIVDSWLFNLLFSCPSRYRSVSGFVTTRNLEHPSRSHHKCLTASHTAKASKSYAE